MKKRYLLLVVKIIAFVVCFSVVFLSLNLIFSRLYVTHIRSFYHMEKDSIEAIFLGPSQMYRGINAQKITDEYGVPSFDFGGDSQPLMITYYYLQEVLKRQKPKVVGVEVTKIFDASVNNEVITYSYPAMPLTVEKYNSLKTILNGDKFEAAKYCVPLIANHSWWNQINPIDIVTDLFRDHSAEYALRGFRNSDVAESVKIDFLGELDGEIQEIPSDSIIAINNIVELCRQNDIQLVFFKTPVAAEWTRNDSKIVKEYMAENGFCFFDMNDNLDEIGIDPEADFCDDHHLNTQGANKTTDYFVRKLKSLKVFDSLFSD